MILVLTQLEYHKGKRTIKETIDEFIILMRSTFMFVFTIYSCNLNLYIIVYLFNTFKLHGVEYRKHKRTTKQSIEDCLILMRSRFMFLFTIYSSHFNLYIIVFTIKILFYLFLIVLDDKEWYLRNTLFTSVGWFGLIIRLRDNNMLKVLLRFELKLLDSKCSVLITKL